MHGTYNPNQPGGDAAGSHLGSSMQHVGRLSAGALNRASRTATELGCGEPVKDVGASPSPVDQALTAEREVIETLEKRVAHLRARLSAVLAPEDETRPGAADAIPGISPLVCIVSEHHARLDAVDRALAELIDRLTI